MDWLHQVWMCVWMCVWGVLASCPKCIHTQPHTHCSEDRLQIHHLRKMASQDQQITEYKFHVCLINVRIVTILMYFINLWCCNLWSSLWNHGINQPVCLCGLWTSPRPSGHTPKHARWLSKFTYCMFTSGKWHICLTSLVPPWEA